MLFRLGFGLVVVVVVSSKFFVLLRWVVFLNRVVRLVSVVMFF